MLKYLYFLFIGLIFIQNTKFSKGIPVFKWEKKHSLLQIKWEIIRELNFTGNSYLISLSG